jgi:hypothetical protein
MSPTPPFLCINCSVNPASNIGKKCSIGAYGYDGEMRNQTNAHLYKWRVGCIVR